MEFPSLSASLAIRGGLGQFFAVLPRNAGWVRKIFWPVLIAALLAPKCLFSALPPPEAASARAADYVIDDWPTARGLPHNTVNAIAQTHDGYIWLATQNGLARFDGVGFAVFRLREGLRSIQVKTLFEDRAGALWVGTTGGGLSRWRGGRLSTLTTRNGLPDDNVTALGEDAQGNLWIGTGAGLCKWNGGVFTNFAAEAGLRSRSILAIARDRQGDMWVAAGEQGLFRFFEGRFITVPGPAGEEKVRASCLLVDRAGDLWAGLGNGTILCRQQTNWTRYGAKQGVMSADVTTLAQDADGIIWAGSERGGLRYARDGVFHPLARQHELSDEAVLSIVEDRDRNLWIGTRAGGLNRLKRAKVWTYGAADGLTEEYTRTVAQTADGALWVGTSGGGLYRGQAGKFERLDRKYPTLGKYPSADAVLAARDGTVWWACQRALLGLKNNTLLLDHEHNALLFRENIRALAEDQAEGLWLGTASGRLMRLRQGQLTVFTNGLLGAALTAIAPDPDGSLWIASHGGGVKHFKNGEVTAITLRQGLTNDAINTLYLDAESSLWIGTAGSGLSRWKDGRAFNFGPLDVLAEDVITQIIEDLDGHLWLGGNHGIVRVRKRELNDLAAGGNSFVHPLVLGRPEGLRAEECSGGFSPACVRTPSGVLGFTTARGLVMVDPKAQETEATPPRVFIEKVLVDGEVQSSSSAAEARRGRPNLARESLDIPAGQQRVEFHYTGLSFAAPERIRFKVRLDGFDKDWIETGTRRVAYYSRLPPAEYKFRVLAANSDGIWSPDEAVLEVTVLPSYWQTRWFGALIVILCLAVLVVGTNFYARRKTQRATRTLALQNAIERERARIAKDIHDDLGASLTHIALVSELGEHEAGGSAQSQSNFQKISVKARAVVQSLDEIVWAVNPNNDNVANFVEYLCQFADECVEPTVVRCWQDVPADLPVIALNAESRHNLFLAAKEALHNVLKHSGATEVWLRLTLRDDELRIVIEDNGRGFTPPENGSTGNGLRNMKQRLDEIGGRVEMTNMPAGGASVCFTLKLQPVEQIAARR